jgi:transposase
MIKGLLADREFIGHEWLSWLQKEEIPFIFRLRENMLVRMENGSTTRLDKLLYSLPKSAITKPFEVTFSGGLKLEIQAKKLAGELLIIGFCASQHWGEKPINLYRKRWKIECGFACLKKKGFDLEATHLQHAERLESLLGVVAIAFAHALRTGQILPKKAKKNHGYNANCQFTAGLFQIISELNKATIHIKSMAYDQYGGKINYAVV